MSFAEKLSKCKKIADRGKTENWIEIAMHFGIIVRTNYGWEVETRGVCNKFSIRYSYLYEMIQLSEDT